MYETQKPPPVAHYPPPAVAPPTSPFPPLQRAAENNQMPDVVHVGMGNKTLSNTRQRSPSHRAGPEDFKVLSNKITGHPPILEIKLFCAAVDGDVRRALEGINGPMAVKVCMDCAQYHNLNHPSLANQSGAWPVNEQHEAIPHGPNSESIAGYVKQFQLRSGNLSA